MNLHISFEEHEAVAVGKLVNVAKRLFRIERTHTPKPKDGLHHVYMNTAKR